MTHLDTDSTKLTTRANPKRPSPPELVGLILILMLAAVLRLGMPGIVEFRQDEANLAQLALDMARGRSFPLSSIDSSVGILQPPGSIYMLVPPFLLSSDPTVATSYIGLLNVLAVLVVYGIARRYYGPVAALTAGALYAASPWAVVYSRKIWLADMVPILAALCIGTALLAFHEGRRGAQLLHLPILAFTGLMHYLNVVMIVPTLYLLIVGRRRLKREFYLSLILAALVFSPYLIGPAAQSLFDALRGGGQVFRTAGERRPMTLTGEAFVMAGQFIGGADIGVWAGDAEPYFRAQYPLARLAPLFNIVPILTALSALWLFYRILRPGQDDERAPLPAVSRRPVDVTVLLWLLATPLMFSITWTPQIYTQYFVTMHGAAYLIIGAAAGDFLRRLRHEAVRQTVLTLAGMLLLTLIGAQAAVKIGLLQFVAANATPNGFSTPLAYYLPLRERILRENPPQVLALLDGQFIGYNEQASIWNVLLYDLPLVRFLQDEIAVLPESATYGYLTTRRDPAEPGTVYLRRFIDSGGPEGWYHYAPRETAPDFGVRLASLPAPIRTLRFANSARLTAAAWDGRCLITVWMADAPARGPANDFFNVAVRLVNAAGETVANADGYFWNGRYWRPGDQIWRRFCTDLPPEAGESVTLVQIGLYTMEDGPTGLLFHNVDVLDANGTPVGPWITIPLPDR